MSNFEDVKTFMKTFGQMVRTKPQFPDEETMQLRYDLIKEELDELEQAMKTKDLKEVADALSDILYVAYGAGCAYGIDLDKCFKEVQRANMSKLGKYLLLGALVCLALVCYFIGSAIGSIAFIVLAVLLELTFWAGIFKPYHKRSS